MYATWKLSYDKLDDDSKLFLQVCSFLHHEGISEDMFEKAALSEHELDDVELRDRTNQILERLGRCDSEWESLRFQKITKLLGSHSLIDYDSQNDTYSVHPLVQPWSQKND